MKNGRQTVGHVRRTRTDNALRSLSYWLSGKSGCSTIRQAMSKKIAVREKHSHTRVSVFIVLDKYNSAWVSSAKMKISYPLMSECYNDYN